MPSKPITLNLSITWPKLIAVIVTALGTIGGAVWGGAKWGLEDRAAILARIDAVEQEKASETRVAILDAYIHTKGTERDVFAAKVCEQLNAIMAMQARTDAKVDKLNDKIDAVLLANKHISMALGQVP